MVTTGWKVIYFQHWVWNVNFCVVSFDQNNQISDHTLLLKDFLLKNHGSISPIAISTAKIYSTHDCVLYTLQGPLVPSCKFLSQFHQIYILNQLCTIFFIYLFFFRLNSTGSWSCELTIRNEHKAVWNSWNSLSLLPLTACKLPQIRLMIHHMVWKHLCKTVTTVDKFIVLKSKWLDITWYILI